MSKNIEKVGGLDRAIDIVTYYTEYFRSYKFYDCKKKSFCKEKNMSRPGDFVYVIHLMGEVNGVTKK